ncbi:MAG TPA: arylamine N-acetyltransferase [Ktedonobacterales bacterium]|jgi:N-hydroxyarylamine O-acetyltransferase|nr:arylamine N-acetyltransferase [Ktedonobacterales bacterium]
MTAQPASRDLRAYLERIACSPDDASAPSLELLAALHQAHLLAVPFENLSIHYGQPIILREAALYDKIVHRRRGGFCYELNGLFAWLLRQHGFTVDLLSAEVAEVAEVAEDGGSFSPPFDHLTLLVRGLEDADWLADVGFGDSFRHPLRLLADSEQDGADGYTYRLRAPEASRDEQAYWVMERRHAPPDSAWEPQYRFTLRPHTLPDFELRCNYQQTSPESHFTQRRICSLALPDGRLSLSDLRLITTINGQREERLLASEQEYQATLVERFGVSL